MGFGLGVMRYSPKVFWGTTLRELAAAVGTLPIDGAVDRERLDELMQRYPDRLRPY
jgi:uncharacterized phage protein (TIGR02216 family)